MKIEIRRKEERRNNRRRKKESKNNGNSDLNFDLDLEDTKQMFKDLDTKLEETMGKNYKVALASSVATFIALRSFTVIIDKTREKLR